MKKLTLIMVLVLVVMAGSAVMADVGSAFGTQATAQALGQRVGYFGVGVGIADYTSVVGSFDYGLSKYTTGRLKLGFTDGGDNTDMSLSMGAEVRWQIWQAGGVNKRAVDLAIGPMIEYFKINTSSPAVNNEVSVFQFGAFVLGSHSFIMTNGQLFTPYAKLNVRNENVHVQAVGVDNSQSDLRVGLGTGVSYQMSNTMNLYGELQFDGNNGFFMGVDFKVM